MREVEVDDDDDDGVTVLANASVWHCSATVHVGSIVNGVDSGDKTQLQPMITALGMVEMGMGCG